MDNEAEPVVNVGFVANQHVSREEKCEGKVDGNFLDQYSQNKNDVESFDSFEIISAEEFPSPDSDEITCIADQPNGFAAIMEHVQQTPCLVLDQIMQNVPDLGITTYVGSLFRDLIPGGNTTGTVDITDLGNALSEEVYCRLNGIKTPDGERKYRYYLEKAVSDYCTDIISQNITGNQIEMDLLVHLGCINTEDRLYLQGKADDPTQCMRALFSMILDRDLKTMFTFVCTLRLRNTQLYENIETAFHRHMQEDRSIPRQCSRCVLIDRVNIRTVVNYLSAWKKIFLKVTEAKLHESEMLWKEFIESINSESMYDEAVRCIRKGIEACGFHADILLMLKNDIDSKKNIFECRCVDPSSNSCRYNPHTVTTNHELQSTNVESDKQQFICKGQDESHFEHVNCLVSSCAETVKKVCIEPVKRNVYNQNSPRVEIKDCRFLQNQHQSTQLKRKNSLTHDSENDETPKRKSLSCRQDYSNPSNENPHVSSNESTLLSKEVLNKIHQSNEHNENGDSLDDALKMENLKVDVPGYDSKQDSGFSPPQSYFSNEPFESKSAIHANSDKAHSLDKHVKMNNLKIGISGYDNEQDSGFSQTQSLPKGSDIIYNEETIPKQKIKCPSPSPLINLFEEEHNAQGQENCTTQNNLEMMESIDADCPERSGLQINQETLIEALEESNIDMGKQDSDLPESDSESRAFINIVVKK